MSDAVKWIMGGIGVYLLYEWWQGSAAAGAVSANNSQGGIDFVTQTLLQHLGPLSPGVSPFSLPAQATIEQNLPPGTGATAAQIAAAETGTGLIAAYAAQLKAQGQTQAQIDAAVAQVLQANAGLPVGGIAGLGQTRQISREERDRLRRAAFVTRSGGTPRATVKPVLQLVPVSRARIVDKNYWGHNARSSRQITPRWVQ